MSHSIATAARLTIVFAVLSVSISLLRAAIRVLPPTGPEHSMITPAPSVSTRKELKLHPVGHVVFS